MRQALLLLRKDLRRLWPQVAVFWAMLAGHTFLDAATPSNPSFTLNITIPALALVGAFFYLIGVLIHEEALTGDRQFWLTRPFDWRSLLAAKTIFVLVFMVLPIPVAQIVTTTANGLPVFTSLIALVPGSGKMLLLAAIAIAFAAVTRNLTQFFLALLAAVITQLVLIALIVGWAYEYGAWRSVEGIHTFVTAMAVLAGIAVLVYIMYRQHAATPARCVLAGLVVLVPASLCLDWWHAAWGLQMRLHANPATAPPVSIRFDRSAPPFPRGRWCHFSGDNVVGVKIPIQVLGIPSGVQLAGERIRTGVELPDGRSWDSGWRAVGGIGMVTGAWSFVRGDGADFLAVNVDTSFFDTAKDIPARIHARLTFTVLGEAKTVQLPAGVLAQAVSYDCLCSVPARFNYSTWCFSIDGGTAHREVYWDWLRTTGGVLYSYGIIDPFSAWRHTSNSSSHPGREMRTATLTTWRVNNHIEVSLDIPEIRLAAYEVGRSQGRRRPGEGLRNEP